MSKKIIRIGIQGGVGSFNEKAVEYTDVIFPESTREIHYLYTTKAVLEALQQGSIDYGQFALYNSIGGLVEETLCELGSYRWSKITTYSLAIEHQLFTHPDVPLESITCIMGHEQALRQCGKNLEIFFPKIPRIGGSGSFTDNASIAQAVAQGLLPKTTAALGHRCLADRYGLKLQKENLQDRSDNSTTFILVGPKSS